MFMADFHLHSTFSDGKLSIPDLVDLYGQRGFGAIAIIDHLCENDTVIGKAAAYLGGTLTPSVSPLYHRSAHILALGVDEFIEANGDVSDLARTIRSKGGLAIAAHPVSTRKVEKQTY